MQRFTSHTGSGVVIDLANIDTDQIIPKQFLKRIERTGYGEFLFYDWRYDPDGKTIEDFALNSPEFSDASILIAGENFGCGSSREHAPWSLLDYGFRVIIAPSFADIFYNNCTKTGLLPVKLSAEQVFSLTESVSLNPKVSITVDLEEQSVRAGVDFSTHFEIDAFRKFCLLNGVDDIGLTLLHDSAITDFEGRVRQDQPFLAFPS